MDNAGRMRRRKCARTCTRSSKSSASSSPSAQRSRRVSPSMNSVAMKFAVDLSDLIDGKDVWMIERRRSFRFLHKATQRSSPQQLGGQESSAPLCDRVLCPAPDTLHPFRPRRFSRRCGSAKAWCWEIETLSIFNCQLPIYVRYALACRWQPI